MLTPASSERRGNPLQGVNAIQLLCQLLQEPAASETNSLGQMSGKSKVITRVNSSTRMLPPASTTTP